jgi:hypothetical protein
MFSQTSSVVLFVRIEQKIVQLSLLPSSFYGWQQKKSKILENDRPSCSRYISSSRSLTINITIEDSHEDFISHSKVT